MAAGSISAPQVIPLRYALGQKKNFITTSTRVELRTETKDCSIFYTLSNKKPDPFQKYGERHTYKYKTPFTLPSGNVTIKALAMSNNETANQSSIVTKKFHVQESESGDLADSRSCYESCSNLDKEQKDTARLDTSLSEQFKHRIRTLSRESLRSLTDEATPLTPSSSPPVTVHQTTSTLSTPLRQTTSQYKPIIVSPSVTKPVTCLYCTHPRSPELLHCTNCGSRLPPLPEIKNEAMRAAICTSCGSEQERVVDNLSSDCIACGEPLIVPPALPILNTQPKTKKSTDMESIVCLYCGTQNQPQLSTCVTCANPLYPCSTDTTGRSSGGKDTIMHPIAGSTYVMCDTCGRVNVADARFCDWCGCRPLGSNVDLLCQNCEKLNDWRCRYCGQCGLIMKCPLRPEIEQGGKMRMPARSEFDHSKWIPIADVDTPLEDKGTLVKVDTKSCGTQTQGLFYPSANTITAKKTSEAWKKVTKKISQDKVLELSTYSPGNGKWRCQVDHICSHLKAYSGSNAELQKDIEDCRIGKLVKAMVEVNNTDYNLSVSLLFNLKDNASNTVSSIVNYLSSTRCRSTSYTGTQSLPWRRNSSRSSMTRTPSRRKSSIHIQVEDHLLIAEVGPDGLGRGDIINSLVEKGGNINLIDTTRGLPLLHLAVSSGHLEAVKAIVELGADINVVSKKNGNTALHEAVRLGHEGGEIITVLLSNSANPNLRNKNNQTACELATSLGYKRLLTVFANHLGTTMLSPLNKQSTNSTIVL